MEPVKLEDVLVEVIPVGPAQICGQLLGAVTVGQLVGLAETLDGAVYGAYTSNPLPPAITFAEDEE